MVLVVSDVGGGVGMAGLGALGFQVAVDCQLDILQGLMLGGNL